MKTPAEKTSPTSAPKTGSIVAPFTYPGIFGSARAEVLARMLEGEAITAADSYHGSSTMRLAAHVHALRRYDWPVLTDEEAVLCADGRVAHIARYRLTPETIAHARRHGAGAWCEKVREARKAMRAKAKEVRHA